MQTKTYSVPTMHCGHCEAAVKRDVGLVAGVKAVDVDLESKLVAVHGDALDSSALVSAIDDAGFDSEEIGG
jgi:copper chaperone CopZ